MKFEVTPAFEGDWGRLTEAERAKFRGAVKDDFHPALERRRADPAQPCPAELQVKSVVGAPGIWAMTWSYSGPDGRTTFEWAEISGEPGVRWRRIGGHSIFGEPWLRSRVRSNAGREGAPSA